MSTRKIGAFVLLVGGLAVACGDRSEDGDSSTSLLPTSSPPTSDADATASGDTSVDPSESGEVSETGTADASDSGSATASESGGGAGPTIVLLTATPMEIGDGDIVTFLAQVTDPDGSEDIVGGLLKTEMGDATYGAFVQISEGSFNLALTWDMINAVEPISFSDDATRTFLAEFNDTTANVATKTAEITFDCGGLAACDGACMELGTDENCSSCGDACVNNEACIGGSCLAGCGNGLIEPGEQCDGLDLQGFDCGSLGLGGGVLACDPVTCTFDTSGCAP